MSDDLSIPNPGFRGSRAGRYGTGPSRVRHGMDPDTRRLTIFAGGLGAVLISLIGASMLIGHRSAEVPVVTADTRPIRIKPENPGGMKIDAAENDVFSGGSDIANSKLAPAAENPDIKALRTAEAPAVAVTTPVSPAQIAAPPAPRPAVVASAPPVAKPVPAKPAPAKPAVLETHAAASPAPVKASAAITETHPAAAAHPAIVQLAALTSEEAARNEWQQLTKRMPELLNGRQPTFSRTDRDGHTFWRVRTAGFADAAQARSFCEHVRAKGGGCSLAEF